MLGSVSELTTSGRRAIVYELYCCLVVIYAFSNRKSIKKRSVNFVMRMYMKRYQTNPEDVRARVDIVTDSYSDGINLKEMTQHHRSIGEHVHFDKNTPFPIDFARDFLRRSENKCKILYISG